MRPLFLDDCFKGDLTIQNNKDNTIEDNLCIFALEIVYDSNLPTRKRREIQSQFYDPRTPKFQNVDVDGILKLKHDLQGINPHIPFAAMLQDNK